MPKTIKASVKAGILNDHRTKKSTIHERIRFN